MRDVVQIEQGRIEMGSFWLWEKDQKMQTPQCSPRSLRHGASQKRLRGRAGCLIKIKILNEHLHQKRSGGNYYIFRMFKSMDCTNLKETSQKMIVDTFAPKRPDTRRRRGSRRGKSRRGLSIWDGIRNWVSGFKLRIRTQFQRISNRGISWKRFRTREILLKQLIPRLPKVIDALWFDFFQEIWLK